MTNEGTYRAGLLVLYVDTIIMGSSVPLQFVAPYARYQLIVYTIILNQ